MVLLVHLPLSSLRVAVSRPRNVFGLLSWCSQAILFMWWIVLHHHGIVLVSSSCGWVGRHHAGPQDPPHPNQQTHGLSSSPPTVRYRARVAYNGYRYQGFQLQPSRNPEKQQQEGQQQPPTKTTTTTTIQGELERVLHQQWRIKSGHGLVSDDASDPRRRTIKVVAAGRTDAGVHARGQAIHFDVPVAVVAPRQRRLSGSSTKPNESVVESNIASSSSLLDKLDPNLWNYATTFLDNDEKVLFHLNKQLPPDIRIWNLQRVPGPVTKEVPAANDKYDVMMSIDANNAGDDGETTATTRTYLWNAMYECTRKLYSYRLALGPVMPPTERHVRWHYTCHHSLRIDPERLRRVLKHYEGTHNFAAFASAVERTERKLAGVNDNAEGSTILNTIRHVYSVDLVPENAEWGFYRVDVCLKGALYKQVRNMVGTALVVAAEAAHGEKGHKSPGATITETELVALLQINQSTGGGPRLQRQHNKCRPAPPEGLTLEHVFFDNDPGF